MEHIRRDPNVQHMVTVKFSQVLSSVEEMSPQSSDDFSWDEALFVGYSSNVVQRKKYKLFTLTLFQCLRNDW